MCDGLGRGGTELPRINRDSDDQWRKSIEDPRTQQRFLGMLAKVPIFSQMSDAFRLAVCRSLRPVEYQKGQVVFQQGEDGDWLGIQLRGELECHVQGDEWGARKIKGVLPGHTIGELNVLGITNKRCETVTSTMPSTLLILSRQHFNDAVLSPKDVAALEGLSHKQDKLAMDAESFGKLDCFKMLGFHEDFASALFGNAERRVLYPGTTVIHEGSSQKEMYILHFGRVNVKKVGKHLCHLTDGACFGMLAALGSQNQATVACDTRCIFTVINGGVLTAMLERFPHCRGAVNHAYVKTLVTHGLTDARQEMKDLDLFYGRVHPLTQEEMIERGLGGEALVRAHQKGLMAKSKGLPSRPSTARRWPPRKISSRPMSALAYCDRSDSPLLVDRRCHSSCK